MSTCEGHIRCLPCCCGMVTVIRRVSFSPSRCEQAKVNRKKFLAVQMCVAASSACLRPSSALRCLPSSKAALRKKRSKEQFCRGRHFVCARWDRVTSQESRTLRNKKNGQSLHLLRKVRNRGGHAALLHHRNEASFSLHRVLCLRMGLADKLGGNRFFTLEPWWLVISSFKVMDSMVVHCRVP